MSKNTGFFEQILKRRLPQFFGIYLAGSWTALEFTQWAVGRYSLSPNWEEVLVVFLLLCLPLILVSAWHHGAPGKQSWSLFEKLFIPLYVLTIPAILYHLYSDVELGKSVTMVMVADEHGHEKEREIAKKEFIKPLVVYPLTNKSQQAELDFIGAISAEAIKRDLSHNQFFSVIDVLNIANQVRRSQLPYNKLPLSLQIKMAKDGARDYFINGTIDTQQADNNQLASKEFVISINLYNAKTGQVEFNKNYRNRNYFSIIDQISNDINEVLLPNASQFTDLPIEDLYTSNWQAFEQYAKARVIHEFTEGSLDEALPLYDSAVQLDPTFSQAAFSYTSLLLRQNKVSEAATYTRLAQNSQDYRLTEKERFALTTINHFLNKRIKETFATLEHWSKVFPNDWQPYLFKSNFSATTQDFPTIITSLKKVIELDPSQHSLWNQIGDAHSAQGQYEQAAEAYANYTQKNPNNPIAYSNLGDLYRKMAKADLAISNYQKALSIAPKNNAVLRNLALTHEQIGNFEQAESFYQQAIDTASTALDEFRSENSLAKLYWNYGKRQQSITNFQQSYKVLSDKISKLQSLQNEAVDAWRYYDSGNEQLANEIIGKAYAYAEENKEEIYFINVQVGEALLLNKQGKAAQALALYDNVTKIARQYLDNGNDAQIAYFKGRSYLALEQYDKALELFEIMNNALPDQIEFMAWPALTLLTMGNYPLAEERYKKILKIAPGYPEYNYLMAKTQLALKEPQKAIIYLEKALQGWRFADTQLSEILEAQQLLQTLEGSKGL